MRRHSIAVADQSSILYTDAFCPSANLLIEAKASTGRGDFRMALGQLLDYRRFLEGVPRCVILLPAQPQHDLRELARVEGIHIIWKDGDRFFGLDGLLS